MSNQFQSNAKPKSKKLKFSEIEKYLPEMPNANDPHVIIPDSMMEVMIQRAINTKENEKRLKEEARLHEEEQRRMDAYRKQQEERSKRQREANKKLPEHQLEMFLSGKRFICPGCNLSQHYQADCCNSHCQNTRPRDVEPLMSRLSEEIRTGKIIKQVVGQQAYDRLVELAKPDESWDDFANRAADALESVSVSAKT